MKKLYSDNKENYEKRLSEMATIIIDSNEAKK